jgi:glycosyltransferase involved in cell wall biosynthesis
MERAQAILAVSSATQRQIEHFFPPSIDKVWVIHEGVRKSPISEKPTEEFPYDREYVLYLGTLEPRKNLVTAIEAFDAFLTLHPEQATLARFVLAGAFGWGTEPVVEAADRVNAKWQFVEPHGVVQALGKVSEEEKWRLLSHAAAFLFPSLYEGFGLPILEAMSAGTPVITTACGALGEVGGDAVLAVDPLDVEQMSFAIAQCVLVPEGTQVLRRAGQEQVKKFSWERAARETMEVILQVMKQKKQKQKTPSGGRGDQSMVCK